MEKTMADPFTTAVTHPSCHVRNYCSLLSGHIGLDSRRHGSASWNTLQLVQVGYLYRGLWNTLTKATVVLCISLVDCQLG